MAEGLGTDTTHELQNGSVTNVTGPGMVLLGSPPDNSDKDWVILCKNISIKKGSIMKSKIKFAAAILAVAVMSGWSVAQVPARKIEPARLQIHVSAPKVGGVNIPVYATIELPEQFSQVPAGEISVLLKEQGVAGAGVPGQIVIAQGGKAQLWGGYCRRQRQAGQAAGRPP